MKIDEKIYSLRKEKNLSQEELADKLNVSRQTISKWETGESCPDFNKIVPLCDLFGITTEELLRDKKIEKNEKINEAPIEETPNVKKSLLICIGVFLYFLAIASIILGEEFLNLNDGVVVSVFFTICGIATATIIFTCMTYPSKKREKKEEKDPILKGIISIASLTTTCIYLLISFLTMAWHITWLIWIIYAIVIQIIKLIYNLKKEENHE